MDNFRRRQKHYVGRVITLPLRSSSGARTTLAVAQPVVTSPPPGGGTIPLTFNDAMFAGVVNSGSISIPNGGSLSYKSITDSGGIASVLTNGAASIDHVRINSREGLRIGGNGTVRVDSSWIETNGLGDDHADSIQAYSPGSRGTLWITNSTIRAYRDGEVAGKIGSVGTFVADNWTGSVTLENVVYWGGQFGMRLHADTGGDILISFKDVYFVGPFAVDPFSFLDYGGHRCVVTKWENVRNATIVNGALVPGALISSP